MKKPFIGFCFICQHNSYNKDEYHTRGLCLNCKNEYFKRYMREYNKVNGHYKYQNKWQKTMQNLPIGLILDDVDLL